MLEELMRFESPEPTLSDVIDLMQKGFRYMDQRFDRLEARVERLERRLDSFEERVGRIEADISQMKLMIADLQDEMRSRNVACDADAERLLQLERRVDAIEGRRVA